MSGIVAEHRLLRREGTSVTLVTIAAFSVLQTWFITILKAGLSKWK